jgi:hypothetical protein
MAANTGQIQKPLIKKVKALADKFQERNGSIYCRELIGYDLSDPVERTKVVQMGLFKTTCGKCILDAVEILEEILET